MIKVDEDGTTLLVTRGDIGSIRVKLKDEKKFTVGQVVSLIVVKKRGYTDKPLLKKSVTITEESNTILIPLNEEDTKFDEEIDKKVDYWYNIVVNDNQTLIGSDKDGEKIFRLYPEPKEE